MNVRWSLKIWDRHLVTPFFEYLVPPEVPRITLIEKCTSSILRFLGLYYPT